MRVSQHFSVVSSQHLITHNNHAYTPQSCVFLSRVPNLLHTSSPRHIPRVLVKVAQFGLLQTVAHMSSRFPNMIHLLEA